MKTVYVDINKELTTRRTKKIAKKLYKINKKEDIVVALSKDLEQNIELTNQISELGIEILNGKWLFKFLLCDIIEYISDRKDEKEENQIVAILMNKKDEIVLSQLSDIAQKVKMLKIIGEFTVELNYLEEKLYNEYGIAIQITNNKRKALTNVDIIINFDYTEEKLYEYSINPQSVLVNIQEKNKKFMGTNINDYKIEYNKENFNEVENESKFNKNVIYEGYIYRRDTFLNIKKQFRTDNVRLIELI